MRTRAERGEWVATHPVRASITVGGSWGAVMGAIALVVSGPTDFAAALSLLVLGVVVFGPLLVWRVRRDHRRGAVRERKPQAPSSPAPGMGSMLVGAGVGSVLVGGLLVFSDPGVFAMLLALTLGGVFGLAVAAAWVIVCRGARRIEGIPSGAFWPPRRGEA